ncbi:MULTISPECIES: tripartite tricarboxylate transporter substrate binding protein [Ramlibacter]|uniref:Tripartite tricarboxylate transporter substrate binding protein n=1 Tax=Ramlibacter aquaticus TaxID=2780094 RepID=A0ABR9SIU4_9BURK|nr:MULTISPECIES: tripartite tricarboxylate transporter substrate binding protein [Ramlibacter]MBE7942270.1 tripartite tricarboxylate transporter substrate binding protein [Ramlibacter aquaticus]
MNRQRRTSLQLLLGSIVISSCMVAAHAQAFPGRQVTLVVPFPAGGPNDIVARALAERLAATWKQPVIVDNKAGATGNVGAQFVARAPGDGHTLLLTLDTSLTANPTIYGKRMGFNVDKDLRPVAMLGRFSQMLVVNPSTGIADIKGFTQAATKAGLTYGSAGNASPGHLTMEGLHSLLTGSKFTHIPYRGNAPALIDLLGGQVQAGFIATPTVAQHVAAGKLKALAVSGSRRSPLAPGVPTLTELGYGGATADFGYALMVPGSTPDATVQQINTDLRKVIADSQVVARLRELDIEPVVGTEQQAAAALKAGRDRWARVIKAQGITGE